MSGSSNNSWTIVTPEETAAAETLRPLTDGTERQDEPSAPTQGLGAETSDGAHGLSEEDHPDQTAEEHVAKPNEDSDASALPSSAPSESSPVPEPQTEGAPVDLGQSSTEPESFSDSYSHLSPSSDETPAPPLSAETLGYLDSGQEEEDEAREQKEPEEESKESKEESQKWSPLETPQDPTDQTAAPETEPELRRRRLEALEKIGQRDEEEEAEEDFQLPQRDEDSGITLNKCILGAVILLGLGTIFISESDYPPVELKESESSGKQEWLNPDISRPGGEAELLDKLTKGNEQIEMLQEQLQVLQSQNEELKLAKTQPEEGSTERLRQEEVQQENSRLKRDVESDPELQKELEEMRTQLESLSMIQKEVQTLRSTLTHIQLYAAAATAPRSGQTENNSHRPADLKAHKKDKYDKGVAKEWKDGEKSEWKKEKKQRKDGGKTEDKEKEWKKDKSEGGRFEKRYKEDKHSKQKDEVKDWKKDKSNRGDEGKPWKEKKEKKEWTNEGDKKHKHDKIKEGRSKEGSKESKYNQETHKGPGDKHWKKGRDDHNEEKKHKYEKKHWKGRDENESRNRKDDEERKEKGKEQKKSEKEYKKQWKNKDEEKKSVGYKEKKHQKEWEEGHFEKYNKHESGEHKDHTWNDKKPAHSQPKPKVGQPEYWSRQRERLQHSSKPQHPCDSPESCARAEGTQPVPLSDFESILKNYLSKAEKVGVEPSHIAELQKLATEVFQNDVFPHDQMNFHDYVEDVGDILEDLVEGEDGSEEEDSAIEDEMEGFEMEVMQKFMLPGKKEGVKADFGKESGRGRG